MSNNIVLKKTCGMITTVVAVISLCVFCYYEDNDSAYLYDAKERTQSYLSSVYGPVECVDTDMGGNNFRLVCRGVDKNTIYEFRVLPSNVAPYDVSRSFYLEALNAQAKNSANEGLMRYLKINTGEPVQEL
ncbi:hypothetical protein [Enterobacter kobei]|uniref:hypothetical protein n=1 Tax=Enterobacter kobei TaxID=208224 RepID=UPI0006813347|nr:hypothetical protein [Enterobacter kobei]